jgi:hypothetical protein
MSPLSDPPQGFPWRRTMLIGLSGLLSYLLIPLGFSNYNDIRSIEDARLNRAVKFGNQNVEFNSKVNATATLLRMVADHNDRMKLSGTQLAESKQDLYKTYRDRRLDLESSWWWPSEFAREAGALQLLSTDEMKQLNLYIEEYKKSVLATMNQITYLWRFQDSPEYLVNDESKEKRSKIVQTMDMEFGKQFDMRNDLVSKIALLFTQSNHRTTKLNLLGF